MISVNKQNLQKESERATDMIKGKVVKEVVRHNSKEVLIEFVDGTRLFVDWNPENVELSITGDFEEEEINS